MKLPPAVMVHGLIHARAAVAPGLPVTLLSAPGAGAYAGIGWWQAVIRQTAAAPGMAVPPHILDCGMAAARAVEALRAGQRLLVLTAETPLFADVAERAARLGATLLPSPPPALDLALPANLRLLQRWLTAAN
jgi:hypothetical protein